MTGMSDPSSMSDQVQNLMNEFDRLTEGQKQEFAIAFLRRTCNLNWPPLDDETIDRVADDSFLEYDIREAADGKG
jgi:hypothetical protein